MTDFRQYDSMSVSVPEQSFGGEFGGLQAAVPGQGGGARSPIFWIRRELTEAFLRVLRNWWLVLGLWCVVSMVLGYFVATFFGKQTWQSSVTLLFQPQVSPDSRDGTGGPNLKTLQSLAKEPQFLRKVIDSITNDDPNDRQGVNAVPIPYKAIETAFKVENPPGTTSLLLTMKWDNKEGANYLLFKLEEQFMEGVRQQNADRAEKDIVELNKTITTAEANVKRLVDEQNKAYSELGITDVKGDQAAIRETISSLEYRLRQATTDEVGAKRELEEIKKKLEEQKANAAKEAETDAEDEALNDTISDSRRRQDRIRELMGDEKERISLQAQLDEKNIRRVALERLLIKNAVAKEDVDKVIEEIHTIKAKMDGNKKTTDYDNEMKKLDKIIVPDTAGPKKKKMKSNPIITQTLDKQLDRELVIMGIADQKDHLNKEIEANKVKLSRLTQKEGEFEEKTNKINAAKANLSLLLAKKSSLEQISSSTKSDLSPYGSPSTGEFASGSTKPLLFGISSLGCITLGLFSLLGWEVFARAGTPSNLARRLEIPVPDLRSRPEELARQSRNFSRQLRQRDAGQGMILTVHPVASTPTCIEKAFGVAKELGASFSKRGERVLIIQLEQAAPGSAALGLSDYLFNRVDSPAMVIRPTEDLSCDLLPCGSERLDADSLSNQRMTDFMEQARERYGVILIVGHALNNLHEVEILASNSQSIVLVADGEKAIDADAREALFELSRMRAPVSAMMIR